MASTLVTERLEPRPVVERFSTHELGPTLERFQSSGMLEEGRINLIGLDAIAERLGDKWEGRQEQVHHHVERTLTRHLEGGGFFQRVSPTDYLVVQPALGKFSAQVSCRLEPVYELKTFAQIGYRIARRVLRMPEGVELTAQELRNLTTADIEKVDLATIARGVSRLKSEQGNAKQPTLFLPVSYTTLASQRGRGPLIARFKEATQGVEKGLVCEITDIEGVPGSALAAVTVMIKPFCLIVVGKLRDPPRRAAEDLRGVRLQGLAFESGQHPLERAEFTAWAEQAIAQARRVTRSVILHGLSGPEYLGLAGLAGATHASLGARRSLT